MSASLFKIAPGVALRCSTLFHAYVAKPGQFRAHRFRVGFFRLPGGPSHPQQRVEWRGSGRFASLRAWEGRTAMSAQFWRVGPVALAGLVLAGSCRGAEETHRLQERFPVGYHYHVK